MTALGLSLAVYTATRECDKYPGHEIDLVTDGTRVLATTAERFQAGSVFREGTEFFVNCGAPTRFDEPCDGSVTFDLTDTTDGSWVSDPELAQTLAAHGDLVQEN